MAGQIQRPKQNGLYVEHPGYQRDVTQRITLSEADISGFSRQQVILFILSLDPSLQYNANTHRQTLIQSK